MNKLIKMKNIIKGWLTPVYYWYDELDRQQQASAIIVLCFITAAIIGIIPVLGFGGTAALYKYFLWICAFIAAIFALAGIVFMIIWTDL